MALAIKSTDILASHHTAKQSFFTHDYFQFYMGLSHDLEPRYRHPELQKPRYFSVSQFHINSSQTSTIMTQFRIGPHILIIEGSIKTVEPLNENSEFHIQDTILCPSTTSIHPWLKEISIIRIS